MTVIGRFRPDEYPSRLRSTLCGSFAFEFTARTDAVVIARRCGYRVPLDPFTPPGIVADWVQEHDDGSADGALLVRLLTRVQDAIEAGEECGAGDGVTFRLEDRHHSIVVPQTGRPRYDLAAMDADKG